MPGRRHVRKRVEDAARQMALQADFVEAPHDEIAAAVILLAHRFHDLSQPCCNASIAPSWLMIEAHIIAYWCTFIIASISAAGPQA